ncbi:hypothetical protein [uncultured Draconibacterium sp.]|uniref:hypothetical protein n=1 Tax=uncultured Draconibacterium sp. TaxID=1573823 RepID=UPI002AA914B9|nr:hypothetical protein [uncultured Draconibacterium sp.]
MKTTKIYLAKNLRVLVKMLALNLFVILLASCDKVEPLLDQSILQGTWRETEPEDLIQFAGSNHTFKFREDSFFLALEFWTDVVYPDDPCEGCPTFSYIKGEYSFDLDKIYLDGVRCLDSTYADRPDGNEVPGYTISYPYKMKSSTRIILDPESEYESITLVKE